MEVAVEVAVTTPEVEAVAREEVTVEVMVVVVVIKMEEEAVAKIGIMEDIINNNLNSRNNNTKVVVVAVAAVETPTNGHNITNKWLSGNKRINNGNSGSKRKEALDAELFC